MGHFFTHSRDKYLALIYYILYKIVVQLPTGPKLSNLPNARSKNIERSGKVVNPLLEEGMQDSTLNENTENSWKEDSTENSNTKLLLPILGFLLICLIGGVILYSTFAEHEETAISTQHAIPQTPPVVVKERLTTTAYQYLENTSEIEIRKSITEAIRGCIEAKTHEERCPYIVGGQSVLNKMVKFYEKYPDEIPEEFIKITNFSTQSINGILLYVARVEMVVNSETKTSNFYAFASKDRMLIEWEASFGYQDLNWNDFLEQKPIEPVEMQICVGIKDLKNNSNHFQLALNSIKGERKTVYIAPNSPAENEILDITKNKSENFYAFVANLRWNSNQQLPEITQFKHQYWINFERLEKMYE